MVRFKLSRSVSGTYEVDVSSLTGSFVVTGETVEVTEPLSEPEEPPAITTGEEPAAAVTTGEDTPSPLSPISWWLIGGVAAGCLIALTTWRLVARRRY